MTTRLDLSVPDPGKRLAPPKVPFFDEWLLPCDIIDETTVPGLTVTIDMPSRVTECDFLPCGSFFRYGASDFDAYSLPILVFVLLKWLTPQIFSYPVEYLPRLLLISSFTFSTVL